MAAYLISDSEPCTLSSILSKEVSQLQLSDRQIGFLQCPDMLVL